MARSDDKGDCDDRAGGTGPRDPSDAARKWLDTVLTPGEAGPQPSSDPIARNPKDVDRPGEAVQTTEVRRRGGVSAPAANAALFSDRPGGSPQRMEAASSATDLLVSVLRFKWTIMVLFVLVSAPIIAAVWTQIVPQYAARAEVRVRPIIPRLVFRTDDNGAIPFYDSFVNTQVSIIRSLTVLQRVLDQPEIQKTTWYKNPPGSLMDRVRGNPTPAIERLRDGLSARPRPRTEIIDVSFTDPIAKEAKLIVDAVLQQYMKYIGEQSSATEDRLYRELTAQYNSLEVEIQSREKTCTDLCKSLGTDAPQALISNKRLRLDETQARLSELRNRIAALEWQTKQIADDSNGIAVASVSERERQSKYYEDEEWRRLDLDVKRIQHQIANSVQKPSHPGMVRAASDVKFAEELRAQREVQLDEMWQERQSSIAARSLMPLAANSEGPVAGAAVVEQQLALAKHEEELLQAEWEKQQAEFNGLFGIAQALERENTELRHKRELYDAVRQRLDQKNIERNVPGSIEVSMWAYSPSRPAGDRRVVFTAMALFAGLGLGGGVAFLRASKNQTIYAAKDMPQPAQAPFLGHVPLVNLRKPLGKALCDEIEQKQVLLIESVRVLRTALLSRLNGQGSTAVVVTSANEGTGKSSFTMVLGKSIAQAGRKVLLIDADLHKMTLSKRLNLADKPGLRESLKDKTAGSLHVFPTETAGLDIMPAGNRSNGDVVFEEIANGAFKNGISRLFEQYGYDIILVDTPPILPVADAAILAGQVDGTIMVEREHLSRRTEVANALIRLGATGGRLLGTVFVGSAEQAHYGYGYSYSSYGKETRES